jgi:hypothetical protein
MAFLLAAGNNLGVDRPLIALSVGGVEPTSWPLRPARSAR